METFKMLVKVFNDQPGEGLEGPCGGVEEPSGGAVSLDVLCCCCVYTWYIA